MPRKPKIGLVLGGGGARGAFTVGVINYLVSGRKIRKYPLISGTSTGALLGTLVCTGHFSRLRKIYTSVKTGDIINPHHSLIGSLLGVEAAMFATIIFGGEAVFETTALKGMIERNVDFAALKERADESLMIYNTVDLKSGESRTFDNRTHAESTLRSALLASSSEPVFMDTVDLSLGGKAVQLTDGGVRELVPLAAAFQSNVEVDLLVAILTNTVEPKPADERFGKLLDILKRTMDLMLAEGGHNDILIARLYNALLRILDNARTALVSDEVLLSGIDPDTAASLTGKRSVPLVVVTPKEHLEFSSLEFDPDVMSRLMDQGLARGEEVLGPVLDELESGPLMV